MKNVNVHFQEIEWTRAKIRALREEIWKYEYRLTEISEVAVRAFNEISEPLSGVVTESVDLGSSPCLECPLGICVYCGDGYGAMSLPGQRLKREWRDEHRGTPDQYLPGHPAMGTHACLFCGVPGQPEDDE